jgi:F-type H+-transporting ATPase subunit delta
MKPTRQAKREATQLFRLCLVNGLLDEDRVRQAVRQIAADKPRGYLATLSYLRRLVKLDRALHSANVVSALPLPADLQASVQTNLARVYGKGLITSFAANPELIGGMRIQVGSDVYDGSIRRRLAALDQSF